jgi:hypothetical protein
MLSYTHIRTFCTKKEASPTYSQLSQQHNSIQILLYFNEILLRYKPIRILCLILANKHMRLEIYFNLFKNIVSFMCLCYIVHSFMFVSMHVAAVGQCI